MGWRSGKPDLVGANRIQEGGDGSTLLDDVESSLQIGMEHAPERIEHGQSNGSPDHELQPNRKVFHIDLLKHARCRLSERRARAHRTKIVFSLTEPGLPRRDSNEKNDAHRLQGAVIEAKV